MTDDNIFSPPTADLGSPAEPQDATIYENLASRWARLGASLIDSIILVVPIIAIVYGTDYWERVMNQNISLIEQMLPVLMGFLEYLVLNGYLLHKRGQTIGKWALGIKIVSLHNEKILPLWKVFFVRYVPQVLVAMIPLAGSILILINDLFIFRKNKRCVHDYIAGTKVIREYAH